MMLRELRPAIAIGFSLALTGCIFLVDSLPDGTSTTCQITTPAYSSGTNACKTCITTSCQAPLNACCADSTCQTQLDNVDSCANDAECNALAQAGGTEGATTDLIACIAANCGSSCSGIDASPSNDSSTTSCTNACAPACFLSSDETQCSCSVSQTSAGNSVACPSSSVSGVSVCCASPSYPSQVGGSCTCQSLECDDEDGVCACELGVTGSGTTTSCFPSGGSSCCLSADRSSCTCDPNDACDGNGEVSVSYCSAEQWQCPSDGTRTELVEDCSE